MTAIITSATLLALCVIGLIYMAFWVRPRIQKTYMVQIEIIEMVYAHRDWIRFRHYCNRNPYPGLEYRFRKISIETFLTEEEISALKA